MKTPLKTAIVILNAAKDPIKAMRFFASSRTVRFVTLLRMTRCRLFFFAVLCLIPISAQAAGIKSAVDEIYEGKTPPEKFSIEYIQSNVVNGDVTLKVEGKGTAFVSSNCAGTS